MQKRNHPPRTNPWPVATVFATLAFSIASAQQSQLNQAFSRPGQSMASTPAESSAYSAALAQADPGARVSAIQQFLIQYPNSPLRQAAIAQMMMAKREVGSGDQAAPSRGQMGRSNSQQMGQPLSQPMSQPVSAPAVTPVNAPSVSSQPVGPPRDSLLQHPAQPAEVAVSPGALSVKADNSSLSGILDQISKSTGMKVDGLSKDDRIFGSYGPGDPHEVLLSLLEGSGYNVVMVGDNKGTPRQLSLSQRGASSGATSASAANNTRQDEDDEIEQEPPPQQEQPQNQPPQGNPEGAPPRNPAEIQQELLRMRQLQQQQQPQ